MPAVPRFAARSRSRSGQVGSLVRASCLVLAIGLAASAASAAPAPGVRLAAGAGAGIAAGAPGADGQAECPPDLPCQWLPGAYAQTGTAPTSYGSYDIANRPEQQKIEYIVIHDTDGSYDSTIQAAANPTWGASWHYTIRSADGHVAQHVRHKDVAWHAGNWYLNAKSIGIEHEGYATAQGTWYTESMYQASAKLVRYLAAKYDIPLDRAHILGHDNVPGPMAANVRGMHWDPGPYWDWNHYFDLLGAPLRGSASADSSLADAGTVLIKPDYGTNRPAYTNCSGDTTTACPVNGSSAVVLHTQPGEDSPLVADLGLHPDGSASTMAVDDTGARASTGQRYAVADRQGDWVAIWYLGRLAWLHNPQDNRAVVWSPGKVVTPKAGKTSIPVYGRAYPEQGAYPSTIPYQEVSPLQYTIAAGQRYTVGATVSGEYYRAKTFDGSAPGDRALVRGAMQYVQIQFGNRVAFVDTRDVDVLG